VTVLPAYPAARTARDRFVLDRRRPRPLHDPWQHQGVMVEDERAADGTIVRVATVFLTGSECPWRCVMCDLWQHTIAGDTPPGALPGQLDSALAALEAERPRPSHAKLYNAGNFFDPRAVPECDYASIADRLTGFSRVIVESHPATVGERVSRFTRALARAASGNEGPSVEVAMGLETAHEEALRRLNKGFTLGEFEQAANRLRRLGASLRAFVLVGVPFIPLDQQDQWLTRSVAFAFDCGASVVSLIPTRSGNGALDALGAAGLFSDPALCDVEAALAAALPGAPGRVFADLWDLRRFADCNQCFDARRQRLRLMNLEQRMRPPVSCDRCHGTPGGAG
jgi:radical SAM enzyme (TIGR01210 family)